MRVVCWQLMVDLWDLKVLLPGQGGQRGLIEREEGEKNDPSRVNRWHEWHDYSQSLENM